MNESDIGDGIAIGSVGRPAICEVGVGTTERVPVKRSYPIASVLALSLLIPFALGPNAGLGAGGAGQQALTVFSNDFAAGIGPYLEDPDGLFSVSGDAAHLAADHPARGYLRTTAADYGVLDFRYEVTVGLANGPHSDVAIVGLGEGVRSTWYGEPQNSIFFRIHSPDFAGGRVDVVSINGPNPSFLEANPSFLEEGLTYKTGPGVARVRIEKRGPRVMFAIDTSYDDTFDATAVFHIDTTNLFPTLNGPNGRLFLGGHQAETTFDDLVVTMPGGDTPCAAPSCTSITYGSSNSLVANGNFETNTSGWQPFNAPILVERVAGYQSEGALKVSISDEVVQQGWQGGPAHTHTTGALASLTEVTPPGWIRVSFDARTSSLPDGTQASEGFLRVNRDWGGADGHSTVKLAPTWKHYEVTLKLDRATMFLVFTLQGDRDQFPRRPIVSGVFELDNVQVHRLPACADVADGVKERDFDCVPGVSVASGSILKISYNAAVADPLPGEAPLLRVTGPWGKDIGDTAVQLGTSLTHIDSYVRTATVGEPLSFRRVQSEFESTSFASSGKFEIRGLEIAPVPGSACDNNGDLATSALNGSFECDRGGWTARFWDASQGAWRSDTMELSRELDPQLNRHVLRMATAPHFPSLPQTSAHEAGASFQLNQTYDAGTWVRVAFDARRADPALTRFLQITLAPHGGFPGTTSVVTTDEWAHYAVAFPLVRNTDALMISPTRAFTRSGVEWAAPGAFQLDHVQVGPVPSCISLPAGDKQRQFECFPSVTAAASETLQVSFDAAAVAIPQGQTALLRVGGPWGEDRGDTVVALGSTPTRYTVNVRGAKSIWGWPTSLKPDQPLSFRLVRHSLDFDSLGAPGTFSISNIETTAVAACDSTQVPETLIVNGHFECDRWGWTPVVWNNATSSWNYDHVKLSRVETNGDHALEVEIPPIPAGLHNYTHAVGAMAALNTDVMPGTWLKIAFDARWVPGSGSRFLRVNLPWGGSDGDTTVQLPEDGSWASYVVNLHFQVRHANLLFTLQPDAEQTPIREVAAGKFQIDHVRVTKISSEQKISDLEGGFAGTLDNFDFFGSSVAALGDLDGDGVSELAVGANGDDAHRGAVWVLFLNADGTVKDERKIADQEGGFTGTLEDFDVFGESVAALGDVDGDGVTDLAVGAPGDDDGGGVGDTQRGAVWVLFLNADGTVKDQQKISELEGGFTGALGDGDRFGISAAKVGDLDGDGIQELAVGADGDDDGGAGEFAFRGAVWVLSLNTDGTVKDHQKISDLEGGFTGTLDDFDSFGAGVGGLGDLDGDGVNDLVVGAIGDDDGGSDHGAVWVLLLNADGTVKAEQKISDLEGGFTGTLDFDDAFGFAVTGPGDLDGDGVADVTIGAFNDDDGGSDRGAVWVLFLNADGTVKAEQKISDLKGSFTGTLDDGDQFGISVAALGDLDGDGAKDIAVGAPNDDDGGASRGAVWVWSQASYNTCDRLAAQDRPAVCGIEPLFACVLPGTGDAYTAVFSHKSPMSTMF